MGLEMPGGMHSCCILPMPCIQHALFVLPAAAPVQWNPLDPADNCLQGLKGILHGSDSQFSVWRIPSAFLKRLKAIAETAQPLPAGLWYSASSAAAAILVATLYEAAPETARRLGGLHATTVVDLRGGRWVRNSCRRVIQGK